MSEYKNEGGAAFPVPNGCGRDVGMSLRDYFAAHAPPMPDWYAKLGEGILGSIEQSKKWPWKYANDMITYQHKEL